MNFSPHLPSSVARWLLAAVAALLLAQAVCQAAPPAPPAPVAMRAATDSAQLLRRLYGQDPAARLWGDNGQAQVALELLRSARSHGLDPSDYHVEPLAARLAALGPHDAGEVDRDLSHAMLSLLSDLHFGRVAPDLQLPAPQEGAPVFDPVDHLRLALRQRRLPQAVDAAAPAIPLYRRVRETLRQYRALAPEAAPWSAPARLPAGGKLVAGRTYPGLGLLRQRLRLLGDLDTEVPAAGQDRHDAELAQALRRFQARHGLAGTGHLDRDTVAALSVPLEQRVRQLELTLERLRWLPPLRPGRIIVVNVAAYRLWAFDTRALDTKALDAADVGNEAVDSEAVDREAMAAAAVDSAAGAVREPLEMRVIVGKAARTPTPLFIGQMRYLEFNPYWNVPHSIARGEIAPKLARNPAYLAQNGMELVSPSGQVLGDAAGPAAVTALRAGTLRVRQRPGAHNVLGAVKFAMPNPMNIYLHSTSAKELFGKTRRDLSHGCIRVERPAELAAFVLSDQPQWSAQAVEAAMTPGPAKTVRLREAIPVVLFYATAATDRKGRALFANDIYRRDEALMRAIDAR